MNENKISGGAYGAIFGVTDIDKSLTIYSDILGYDRVVYDKTGIFPDLASLPGGEKELRRVLLKRTIPFSGYFNRIFGQSVIELISAPGNPGKRIFRTVSGAIRDSFISASTSTKWTSSGNTAPVSATLS